MSTKTTVFLDAEDRVEVEFFSYPDHAPIAVVGVGTVSIQTRDAAALDRIAAAFADAASRIRLAVVADRFNADTEGLQRLRDELRGQS